MIKIEIEKDPLTCSMNDLVLSGFSFRLFKINDFVMVGGGKGGSKMNEMHWIVLQFNMQLHIWMHTPHSKWFDSLKWSQI